jgi:hypothetical protein
MSIAQDIIGDWVHVLHFILRIAQDIIGDWVHVLHLYWKSLSRLG